MSLCTYSKLLTYIVSTQKKQLMFKPYVSIVIGELRESNHATQTIKMRREKNDFSQFTIISSSQAICAEPESCKENLSCLRPKVMLF